MTKTFHHFDYMKCSRHQCIVLRKFGYLPDSMSFDEASEIIKRLQKNGWQRPMHLELESVVDNFLMSLETHSDEDRKLAFEKIGEKFCVHCGRKQKPDSVISCQCWNDE